METLDYDTFLSRWFDNDLHIFNQELAMCHVTEAPTIHERAYRGKAGYGVQLWMRNRSTEEIESILNQWLVFCLEHDESLHWNYGYLFAAILANLSDYSGVIDLVLSNSENANVAPFISRLARLKKGRRKSIITES